MKVPDKVRSWSAAVAAWARSGRGQKILALLTLAPFVLIGAAASFYPPDSLEDEPIRYRGSDSEDAVARLEKRLERGEVRLRYAQKGGYLTSVLAELGISPLSQTLVFSKTSVQHPLISTRHPRALYFGDDTYVGWVDGGAFLEITTIDPKLGAVFYVMEQRPDLPPRFLRRNDECLMCHSVPATGNVPGLILRSLATRVDGTPNYAMGNYITTDKSPLAERWGGWYVTGTHGAARHRGNNVLRGDDITPVFEPDRGANITDLSRFLDTTRYLTPHSDIVALLVMEHQATVQNLITRAGHATRRSQSAEKSAEKQARLDELSAAAREACEALVRGLLFADAAPLPAPVTGTSRFAAAFQKRGPFDRAKRSLYQLDLKTRLLRYPCSYLIYSSSFDGLPASAKQYVYRRLGEVLQGADTIVFPRLTAQDRAALRDILRDTKTDLAPYLANTERPQRVPAAPTR